MSTLLQPRYATGWEMEAILSDKLLPRDVVYAEGFKEAAHVLAEHARNARLDALVYPIIFNFRQYFELTLKRMYVVYGLYDARLHDRTVNAEKAPRTHDLTKLWNEVRPRLIALIQEQGDDADCGPIDRIVQLLNDLDPSSEASRYADTTKGGKLHELDRLNVGVFMNMADEAVIYLDGTESWLDELLNTKRDLEEYYAPDYAGY